MEKACDKISIHTDSLKIDATSDLLENLKLDVKDNKLNISLCLDIKDIKGFNYCNENKKVSKENLIEVFRDYFKELKYAKEYEDEFNNPYVIKTSWSQFASSIKSDTQEDIVRFLVSNNEPTEMDVQLLSKLLGMDTDNGKNPIK